MSNENKYVLNDKEREEWYNYVVKPCFLDDHKKSKNPTFFLITGQPGAGKTTASAKIAENADPYPVKFGGDDIRMLHPHYDEIIKDHFADYPFITKPDMSWARQKLIDDSIMNGYNIQLDCILSNPNDWRMGTLLQAKSAGYRVECIVLGVHRYLSEVSMFKRCEEQKLVDGKGFPPTLEVHDTAYKLLPDIISKMYSEKVADKIMICNRNFDVFYNTDDNHNPTVQGIRKGLYQSRQSCVTADGLNQIKASWDNVQELMSKREHSETEFLQMKKCYNAFCENSGINNRHNTSINNAIFIIQQANKTRK